MTDCICVHYYTICKKKLIENKKNIQFQPSMYLPYYCLQLTK